MEADFNPIEETIPEPEQIQRARKVIDRLAEMVNAGDINALSVYVENREGLYVTYQVGSEAGRHEDAGRLIELAMKRLGYVQREDVEKMIDEA